MIKTISTLLMLTTLLFACKKVEEEPDPVVLVSHGSFEMEGTFTTDGWITNNTSSDPNTPVNGGGCQGETMSSLCRCVVDPGR